MTNAPPLTRDALVAAFRTYGRPASRWLVGGEFERHVLDASGWPAPYEGGVRPLLEAEASHGWVPKREDGAIIAMHRGRAAITLEPGGQVELSGAPHVTARAVAAEAGGTWACSVQLVLESARPGDLVLVQADVAQDAMPWLMEKYGSRLRETTLDEMAATVVARRLA